MKQLGIFWKEITDIYKHIFRPNEYMTEYVARHSLDLQLKGYFLAVHTTGSARPLYIALVHKNDGSLYLNFGPGQVYFKWYDGEFQAGSSSEIASKYHAIKNWQKGNKKCTYH